MPDKEWNMIVQYQVARTEALGAAIDAAIDELEKDVDEEDYDDEVDDSLDHEDDADEDGENENSSNVVPLDKGDHGADMEDAKEDDVIDDRTLDNIEGPAKKNNDEL